MSIRRGSGMPVGGCGMASRSQVGRGSRSVGLMAIAARLADEGLLLAHGGRRLADYKARQGKARQGEELELVMVRWWINFGVVVVELGER